MSFLGTRNLDTEQRELEDRAWIGPGKQVSVSGYEISGGLVFVADSAAGDLSARFPEPSLIDAALPVGQASGEPLEHVGADRETGFASYRDLSPGMRGTYLKWLSGARRVDQGAAFLNIYVAGLERRFLSAPFGTASELVAITAELYRLLSEFEVTSAVVPAEAERVITMLISIWETIAIAHGFVQNLGDGRFPNGVDAIRMELGLMANRGERLSADVALSWINADPAKFPLPRPARRCPVEFDDLFVRIYEEHFREGLRLPDDAPNYAIRHEPINQSLTPTTLSLPLPDVGDSDELVGAIDETISLAAEELDPYSRWVVRNPGKQHSQAAVWFLPARLLDPDRFPPLRRMHEWLDGLDDGSDEHFQRLIKVDALLDFWFEERFDLEVSHISAFIRLLEKLGYGVEPDRRFFGPPLRRGEPAVIFRSGQTDPRSPTPEYTVASLTLHLLAAVAAADGTVTDDEERFLERYLERAGHLGDDELARLRAHTEWLIATKPDLTGVRDRLSYLNEEQRGVIGESIVLLAAADGEMSSEELTLIAKILDLLDSDVKEKDDLGDLTFRFEIGDREHEFEISTASQTKTVPLPGVDEEDIARKLEETAAVHAYLGSVFGDDPEEPGLTAAASSSQATTSFVEWSQDDPGELDGRHIELLSQLLTKESWDRIEVEQAALSLDLMPDGALEIINEAAFERLGQPVISGDEEIEVDAELGKELVA